MKVRYTKSPYSNEQIVRYLRHINFPLDLALDSSENDPEKLLASFTPSLDNLKKLIRYHLPTFCYENVAVHYSADSEGSADLSPQPLYKRMVVENKGLGSFCFGLNSFMKAILQGLKYRVYAVAVHAIAAPPGEDRTPKLTPFMHIALIVQFPKELDPEVTTDVGKSSIPDNVDEKLYYVDVGFGGVYGIPGPVVPIPLVDGSVVPGPAPPEEHRLIVASHPLTSIQSSSSHSRSIPLNWYCQGRKGAEEWCTLFHFNLACEAFDKDVEMQSSAILARSSSLLVQKVIVVKTFKVEGDPMKALGRYMVVGDKFLKRVGDKTDVLAIFKTEEERMEVIREYCGVDLDLGDVVHILGRASAIS